MSVTCVTCGGKNYNKDHYNTKLHAESVRLGQPLNGKFTWCKYCSKRIRTYQYAEHIESKSHKDRIIVYNKQRRYKTDNAYKVKKRFEQLKNSESFTHRESVVYALISESQKLCYVGCTTEGCTKRLKNHADDFKSGVCRRSMYLLQYPDVQMKRLEYKSCRTRVELESLEREYINKMNEKYTVVNHPNHENKYHCSGLHIGEKVGYDAASKTYDRIRKRDAWKYYDGKIYKIESPSTDKIYIGSTTWPLHIRLGIHCGKFADEVSQTTCNEILQYGDFTIKTLETFRCKSKAELEYREAEFIASTSNCVNKNFPGSWQMLYERYCSAGSDAVCLIDDVDVTDMITDLMEAKKHQCEITTKTRRSEYYKAHKHIEFENAKLWRKLNPERVRAISRKSHHNRKHIVNPKRVKKYREDSAHRAKLKSQRQVDFVCECGITISDSGNVSKHLNHPNHAKRLSLIKNNMITPDDPTPDDFYHCETCNQAIRLKYKSKHESSEPHRLKLKRSTMKPNSNSPFPDTVILPANFDSSNVIDCHVTLNKIRDKSQIESVSEQMGVKFIERQNGNPVKYLTIKSILCHLFGSFRYNSYTPKHKYIFPDGVHKWCSVCCDSYADSRGRETYHNNLKKHRINLNLTASLNNTVNEPWMPNRGRVDTDLTENIPNEFMAGKTNAELKVLWKSNGLKGYSSLTKAKLIAGLWDLENR